MAAPRLYKTEAIVLRQRKLGESDRILTLHTPTYGKVEAKAKGVRKTTSRMSGYLQPLNRVMVQLAQGRSMEVIAGCEGVESFHRLREDLEGLSRGLYAAELADRFLPERAESNSTYRLLLETLRRLQGRGSIEPQQATKSEAAHPSTGSGRAEPLSQGPKSPGQDATTHSGQDLTLRYYEMRLLEESGFRPELERCLGCGEAPRPEPNYFSPVGGGTYCGSCGSGVAGSRTLSVNGLKVMRLMQRQRTYNEVGQLAMPPELSQEVERHLRAYIVCVLERDVNSAAFVERLRREQSPPVEV